MILKGSQRGNGRELANHLMRGAENEHIELHDIRGFIADDLHGAMQECEAIAKGTRCENHLFSLSLNPPQNESVPVEDFEASLERIEGELGLDRQPRAVVFHEKKGRRHAHAVWSRINGDEMTAIKLDYYKRTLNGIARDLYREHGWEMPKGFRDRDERDPLSFSRDEWQQAKRTRQDPKVIKETMREAWASSDNRQAFEAAMRERGYFLARGDKRGYVAVDWRGEIYSLSRTTGAKTKELKARLGEPDKLPSVNQAKSFVSERMTPRLKTWAKEAENEAQKESAALKFQREQMVQRQRHLRDQLKRQQEERWQAEEKRRAERVPSGIRGLWGWVTGKNKKIRQENEAEITRAQERDRAEKQAAIERQLAERRKLQERIEEQRAKQAEKVQALNRDVAHYMMMGGKAPIEVSNSFEKQNERQREQERNRQRERDRDRDRGHEPN